MLFSTFTTVFVAELGDKTQLATLLLSAQSGSPVLVFIGAALALIASSLVGVLVGQWLAKTLPPERLELMAGVLMVALGIWLGLAGRPFSLAQRQRVDDGFSSSDLHVLDRVPGRTR